MLPAPLDGIAGVWKFSRPPFFHGRVRATPGHLLHYVAKGSYRLRLHDGEQAVRAGDLIYYHESEWVEWTGNASAVTFYSVGFQASRYPPFPAGRRVFPARAPLPSLFRRLHEAWEHQREQQPFRIHALLNTILHHVERALPARPTPDSPWARVEAGVRAGKLFRPAISDLTRLAGVGRGVLFRDCHAATGTTPMRRLRAIRMDEARAQVAYSHQTLSQIADYLGYPRIHEFSREFRLIHGRSPRAYRQRARQ